MQLLCGADRPLAHPGESVIVRAWVVGETETSVVRQWQWRWQAGLGSIDGAAVATWRFVPGALPKDGSTVTATVQATAPGGGMEALRCEVDIELAKMPPPQQGPSRGDLTGRAFVLKDEQAPAGFGMYSYLLLQKHANEEEKRRNLNALTMFLWLIEPSAEMQRHRDKRQLNLALIPVLRKVELPQPMPEEQVPPLAAHILEVYDYSLAQSLLSELCVTAAASGPHLVAVRERGGCPRPNLLMDMSKVPPDLVPDWIRTFRSQATAQRSWSADTMTKLRLTVRSIIAVSYSDVAATAENLSRLVRLTNAVP